MIKIIFVLVLLGYASAMPTNSSETMMEEPDWSISNEEFDMFANLMGSIKHELWDNTKIFQFIHVMLTDEMVRNEVKGGLMEVFNSTNKKDSVYNFFSEFEDRLEKVNETAFDMSLEEIMKFSVDLHEIKEELVTKGRIYEAIREFMTNGEFRDRLVDGVKAVFLSEEPKEALYHLMHFAKHELGLEGQHHKFEFPNWDQLFGNGSQFNFNLTGEDIAKFEATLHVIKVQLWDNKRIFEALRALAMDEQLRNDTLNKLHSLTGEDPKDAIYDAFKALEDKLVETEGQDNTFNMTLEEEQMFDQTFDYIKGELYDNKKVFHFIHLMVHDGQTRHRVVEGIKEIMFGDEPKMAVHDFFSTFAEELSKVNGTAFDMSLEEEQKFDEAYDQIMAELFGNRRIYEAIREFMTNGEFRDRLVDGVKAVFLSEEPKEALYHLMHFAKHELGLDSNSTMPTTTIQPNTTIPSFNQRPENLTKVEIVIPEEKALDFERLVNEIKVQLIDKNRLFEVARALTRDFRLRDEVVLHFSPLFHSEDINQALFDAIEWVSLKLSATEGTDPSFEMTQEEQARFDSLINDITSQLTDNQKIAGVIKAVFLDMEVRTLVITHLSGMLLGLEPKQSLFDFLEIFPSRIPSMESNNFGLTSDELALFESYFDEIVLEVNDRDRMFEVVRGISQNEEISNGVLVLLENLLVGPDPKQSLLDAMQAFQFEMFKQ